NAALRGEEQQVFASALQLGHVAERREVAHAVRIRFGLDAADHLDFRVGDVLEGREVPLERFADAYPVDSGGQYSAAHLDGSGTHVGEGAPEQPGSGRRQVSEIEMLDGGCLRPWSREQDSREPGTESRSDHSHMLLPCTVPRGAEASEQVHSVAWVSRTSL